MRFIDRFRGYALLLHPVKVHLISGKTVTGLMVQVHEDFFTVSSRVYGIMDIPFSSVMAISPLRKIPAGRKSRA